jgi:hypothetical protein
VPSLRWRRARVMYPLLPKQQQEFWVLFHKGEADKLGTPLNSYSRFSSQREAETVCAAQMAERSVEQKLKGSYFSVRQETEAEGLDDFGSGSRSSDTIIKA